jgi:acrylyl-CoA reductase (NADPH)
MSSQTSFKAMLARQGEGREIDVNIETLTVDDLPQGNVLVKVLYSSLNFKDAAAMANRGIFRQLPIVPGIDLAGIVEASGDARYRPGDEVVLTGWLVGEQHWGGLSQYARVDADWLVRKPAELSLRDCMAIGTAGLTAMLGVLALEEQGLRPGDKEVLVTGAAGGVGSTAVTLFARKGYRVAALTGRPETSAYLQELGAQRIVARDAFVTARRPGRASMDAETYSAALDVVGGTVLSSILPQMAYGGSVAVCGLAGGVDLDTTVFPFILRAIRMIGIDSVRAPAARRAVAWQAIAGLLGTSDLNKISTEIELDQVPATSQRLLAGQIRGRCVVRLW